VNSTPRVLRHPRAERDIEEQVDYYLFVERAPAIAARFVDAVQRGLELLVEHPEAGAPYTTTVERLNGIRRWPVPGFGSHIVFYRTKEGCIEIVRILHGARDLEAALGKEA